MLSIFLDVAGAYLVSLHVRALSTQLFIAIALGIASSITGNFIDHIFLPERTIDETLARTIAGALLWHPCIFDVGPLVLSKSPFRVVIFCVRLCLLSGTNGQRVVQNVFLLNCYWFLPLQMRIRRTARGGRFALMVQQGPSERMT